MQGKLTALFELSQHQAQIGNFFVRAETAKLDGDYESASVAYHEYITASKAYLNTIISFNKQYLQSPFSLAEVVQPLINALMVCADIEASLGKREAAESLRTEASAFSRTYLGRKGSAEAERARAASLTLEGRFNEAIVALMEARDVILEADDKVALARIAIDLADLLNWLGDYKRASDEIDHASSIIESVGGGHPVTGQDVISGVIGSISSIMSGKADTAAGLRAAQLYREYVEITFYRGLIAKALRKWDAAEACFQKVLPEYSLSGKAEAIEYQLAQIKLGRGDYGAALQQATNIAGAFEKGAYRAKRPVLYRTMAECLHALGESSAALRLLRDAIDDLQTQHLDPDALWRAQHLLARVLADTGDRKSTLNAYRDAIATISSLRRAPLGYRLDSTFLADKTGLYSMAIDQAARDQLAADCCEFMDSLKSRTLTAVLSMPRAAPENENVLEAQFDAITRELDAIEYLGYRNGPSDAQTARTASLLATRTSLLERIRVSDARWRRLSVTPTLNLQVVSTALSRRSQAALSFYYNAPDLTCVLLWRGEIHCARQSIGKKLVADLADYAGNLSKNTPDVYKHDLSAEYGTQAIDLIPEELLEAALSADSLVVVPHGVLHLLPWAALIHNGKRLFEYLPVAVSPNVGLLAGAASSARPRSVSLIGVAEYPGLPLLGDLPSARLELADISNIYDGAHIPVWGPRLDGDATEAGYLALSGGISGSDNILHLSCHGTMVQSEPMNSGLLLSDSKLDAAEVASKPLPFDEVVLSACSTGWRPTNVAGIVLNADEILGIPGAFLEAGAKSVLVSISKAEGKAARTLTTHYHRRRVAGDAPTMAMQAAQKQVLSAGLLPGTWAGFALYSYV
jgi:CHAT domain-containing protein